MWKTRGALPFSVSTLAARPAFELVVVIGIENVVFPVVLIVDHGVDRLETGFQFRPGPGAFRAVAIDVAVPDQEGVGKVDSLIPDAFVDQRL